MAPPDVSEGRESSIQLTQPATELGQARKILYGWRSHQVAFVHVTCRALEARLFFVCSKSNLDQDNMSSLRQRKPRDQVLIS